MLTTPAVHLQRLGVARRHRSSLDSCDTGFARLRHLAAHRYMNDELTNGGPDGCAEDSQITLAAANQSDGGSSVGTGIAAAGVAVLPGVQALYVATGSLAVTIIGATVVVVIAVTLTIAHRRSR